MGGAFVAVADDSTATWWNPAGLAAGAFTDMSIGKGETELRADAPARRDRVSWFAISAPSVGFSYYRLRITDIRRSGPTDDPLVDREDTRNGLSVRSFSANELGLTVVQTLLPGVHAGATLKYVRGTLRTGLDDASRPPSDVLDSGEDLEGGDSQGKFDLDIGVIGVAGPVRVGAVMKNVRAPEFADGAFVLPRQSRVGAAVVTSSTTLALDADVQTYVTGTGDRRVIAVGAEQWLLTRRLGVRGGARFNQVGGKERAATGGLSVALRKGSYVEGELTRGGTDAERGWSLGARVTF